MKGDRTKKVNRMIGKIPLIGNFTPIQCVNICIAFIVAYIVHANFNQLAMTIGVWLWVFFTLTLVLGSHHWQYINKYRSVPRWVNGRLYYCGWYSKESKKQKSPPKAR
ncbi:MAG: hypothetical protein N5P05_002699 [Chroococcopsis gigantea SAG 12.99]|jgi:hypothetical protein|nr:hypothetical protein [Chlorogloea purpurea SAG 13.99]MDV3001093.1 hypothetical protein [Chroococcopsis gigantea SAG 12.99]